MALGKGLGSILPPKKNILPTVIEPEINTTENSSISKTMGENGNYQFREIPIDRIFPNPEQPRKDFTVDELYELVDSIRIYGVLQPITVTEKIDGTFELIAGERRLRASKLAKLQVVPALVKMSETDMKTKLEMALIENIQRQDLNPIEEAESYKKLVDVYEMSVSEVALKVGKSIGAVSNSMRLLTLPEQIIESVRKNELSETKARTLLGLRREEDQLGMFQALVQGNNKLTVRDLEYVIKSQDVRKRKTVRERDNGLIEREKKIEDLLGTRVSLMEKKGERGKIIIEYYSKEDFDRLMDMFESGK
jgi:ParB family chromosome partitioning protein